MIRLLRGQVAGRGKDWLLLDVGNAGGGVGFKVFAPEPTVAEHANGADLLLHTYLQVREDALTLFGFATEDELTLFEQLISVSGVGPKIGLALLSAMSPDALRMALSSEEPGLLSRVSGVGKRTAEKIIVELKDKVRAPLGSIPGLLHVADADSEVVEALIALGYSVVESQRAVQSLPKDVKGVEDRLRMALSKFAG